MPDRTALPIAPRRIGGAAVLAAVLLAAAPLAAQEWSGRGRLQGSVKDEKGEPIAGAKIVLRKAGVEGMGPEPLASDEKGRWAFLGLANGSWSVTVEAKGYVPAEGPVAVSEFSANPPVNMELRPIPKEVQEAAEGNEALERIAAGNAHLEGGRPGEARTEYEAALALLEPVNHPPVLRGVARAHYQEGHATEAIAALEKALAIEPTDEETLRLVVNLLVASGREEEAKTYMARLPEGAKVEPETLLNLGIKAYNDGDTASAIATFDQVVGLYPDLADAYYYRGLCHLGQGSNDPAKADFEKLLALAPEHEKVEEVKQFLEYLKSQS